MNNKTNTKCYISKHDLSKLLKAYKSIHNQTDKAAEIGLLDIGGKFHEAIFESIETIIKVIDPDLWITWYIYDTECGKKCNHAWDSDGKEYVITNDKEFVKMFMDFQEQRLEDKN